MKYKTNHHQKESFTHVQAQKAIVHGRHPRSLNPAGDMWMCIKDSKERLRHVRNGRRLYVVNNEMLENPEQSPQLHKVMSQDSLFDPVEAEGATAATAAAATTATQGSERALRVSTSREPNSAPPLFKPEDLSPKSKKTGKSRRIRALERKLNGAERQANAETGSRMLRDERSSKGGGASPGARKASSGLSTSLSSMTSSKSPTDQINGLSTNQEMRLHFGSIVALQSAQDDRLFMCVHEDLEAGVKATVMAREAGDMGRHDVLMFKLVDLHEPTSLRPIYYDDTVYLQICGTPDTVKRAAEINHWREGSVLGGHMHSSVEMQTVDINPHGTTPPHESHAYSHRTSPQTSPIHRHHSRRTTHGSPTSATTIPRPNTAGSTMTLGSMASAATTTAGSRKVMQPHLGVAVPIKAFVPRLDSAAMLHHPERRENVRLQSIIDNSTERGNGSVVLGTWKIRPATHKLRMEARERSGTDHRTSIEGPVMNYDTIYLEQDCFYMSTGEGEKADAKPNKPLWLNGQGAKDSASRKVVFYPLNVPTKSEASTAMGPSGAVSSAAMRRNPANEVERKGMWTLRISHGSSMVGMTRAEITKARCMGKAREILEESAAKRLGRRRYIRNLGKMQHHPHLRQQHRHKYRHDDAIYKVMLLDGNLQDVTRQTGKDQAMWRKELAATLSSEDGLDPAAPARSGGASLGDMEGSSRGSTPHGGAATALTVKDPSDVIIGGAQFPLNLRLDSLHRFKTHEAQQLEKHTRKLRNVHHYFERKFDQDTVGPHRDDIMCLSMLTDAHPASAVVGDADVVAEGARPQPHYPPAPPSSSYDYDVDDDDITAATGESSHISLWSYGQPLPSSRSLSSLASASSQRDNRSGRGSGHQLQQHHQRGIQVRYMKQPLADVTIQTPIDLHAGDPIEEGDNETVSTMHTQGTFLTLGDGERGDMALSHHGGGGFEAVPRATETPRTRKLRLLRDSTLWEYDLVAQDAIAQKEAEQEQATIVDDGYERRKRETPELDDRSPPSPTSRAAAFSASIRSEITAGDLEAPILEWFTFWKQRLRRSRVRPVANLMDTLDTLMIQTHEYAERQATFQHMLEAVGLNGSRSPRSRGRPGNSGSRGGSNNGSRAPSGQSTRATASRGNSFMDHLLFNEEASLEAFGGNAELMEEMLVSSVELIQTHIAPMMAEAKSEGGVSRILEIANLVEHITECLVSECLAEGCRLLRNAVTIIEQEGGKDYFIPQEQLSRFHTGCQSFLGRLGEFCEHVSLRNKRDFISGEGGDGERREEEDNDEGGSEATVVVPVNVSS